MKSRRLTPFILLGLYILLTILFTYPLVLHVGTHHVGEDGGDARVYLWNYWWVEKALTDLGTSPFESDYVFYPVGIGLSLHTLSFLQGLFYIPLNAVFGPVTGPNLIILWTFLASAIGAYLLARHLGASRLGAFLAGLVFAYCPYRLARIAGHYDLLGTEWIPFYVLVLLMALRSKETRWIHLLGAGSLAAACGYTALSYLVFLGFFTILIAVRELAKQAGNRAGLIKRVAVIALVAGVLLAPLLARIFHDLTLWDYPTYPGADRYVANVVSYLVPGQSFDRNLTETTVFPGYLVLVLGAAACVHPRIRRSHCLWIISAGVFFVLSLGASLHIGGWKSGIPLPFALFDNLPLLHNLRAPSRFSILVMLCLAVLSSAIWTSWMERSSKPTVRFAWTAGATLVVAAEFIAIPIPVFQAGVAPIYDRIKEEPGDFTVVEIPGVEQIPGRLMYHQTFHGKRIFIGTAARVPREKTDYYFGLHLIRPLVDLRKGKLTLTPELVEAERTLAPKVARFLDIRYFVVDRSYDKRGVVDFLEQVLPVDSIKGNEEQVLFRVRDNELPPLPRSIDAAAAESRLYFENGWSRPEEDGGQGFRWATDETATVLVRRPFPNAETLFVKLAPLENLGQRVELRWNGTHLGTENLTPGWSELQWTLPPPGDRRVERLEFHFSNLRQASDRDRRRLAARIAEIRFE
jgi:hypothetical protein